jgi:hypothetical protein
MQESKEIDMRVVYGLVFTFVVSLPRAKLSEKQGWMSETIMVR